MEMYLVATLQVTDTSFQSSVDITFFQQSQINPQREKRKSYRESYKMSSPLTKRRRQEGSRKGRNQADSMRSKGGGEEEQANSPPYVL